jgi:beta-mannanase
MKIPFFIKVGTFSVLIISTVFVGFLYTVYIYPAKNIDIPIPKKNVQFGVIDGLGLYDNDKKITVENRFVSWKKDDTSDIKKIFEEVSKKNRATILTVEPWGFSDESREELLPAIIKGEYASTIISICKEIDLQPNPVYLRWGHEMDLFPGSRYNWAQSEPRPYITAFQYVTNLCRKQTKNVRMLWSPGGKAGFTAFYPGDEYVDAIGFSIFSYEAFELKNSKRNFNFIDLFDYRYNQVKGYRKEIVIAEMGVAGTNEYKENWIRLAMSRINNPEIQRYLKYVVYFNEDDNIVWDVDLPKPNFTIKNEFYPNKI